MGRIRDTAVDLARAIRAALGDFESWPTSKARLFDEIEAVLSVLLAIAAAHLMGLRNVGWAAFSGYMVMRSHVAETFGRGALRVAGTAAGALLAVIALNKGHDVSWLQSALLVAFGFLTLYGALISQKGYAWLFAGLTFAMVLIDGMQHPDGMVVDFALSRFEEVLIGTAACVLVSAASTVTLRRTGRTAPSRPAKPLASQGVAFWNGPAFSHAMQGAIALGLIPVAWRLLGIESLDQSSITIMAVMTVPISSLSLPRKPTSTKLIHRFAGCLAGGLLAAAILVSAHHSPLLMTLGVCFGVVIGKHIENGKSGVSYLGTQFALAFLVILVPDAYAAADLEPGLDRLFGIVFGMLLLEPVRLLFRMLLEYGAGHLTARSDE
ncbi:FUSC family protein [Paraburkholderia silvatlantica]|uniref:Membrane protein YccC n=1 Tax=Paraburkholderia silvatlantica TaxID=321895 RepID=A0ABR6FGD8_9BURK|nr:FUSC family protein [Paraburkholderia silvatlantica]MBB2926456.1 putative membrane protein YccC [Paraburkholderia silvatlantica]PVY25051.1 fusaric acid resistance family protein [Paraburkholderia silvatlantica]PXW30135.1 fusaric acid resistance family protein [Paraburkholderia silvatlantica]